MSRTIFLLPGLFILRGLNEKVLGRHWTPTCQESEVPLEQIEPFDSETGAAVGSGAGARVDPRFH
jgi:hypothetical protein